jgi:hypothetical protein
MSDSLSPYKDAEKEQQNRQFSKRGVYIREDDQDWGNSGIDILEQEANQS